MKIQDLISWYNNLSPSSLTHLKVLYDEGARFRDPFNDVCGHDAIIAVFEHMYEQCDDPGFQVSEHQVDGSVAWVSWVFQLNLHNKPIKIPGTTRFEFGEDGRVIDHRDYWDSADLLVEFPMLGSIIRYTRKRLSLSDQQRFCK
ncbi:MAG: hypothetical protein C0631_15805 [Sedimenticola sp.]|nr:MAG: hypothetical protein C0631_15805 [Sedimenticola sp.]